MAEFQLRVYYEDTDAGGVVYYANYLKFAERARTEMLRQLGVEQRSLAANHDILFIVRKAEIDLKSPARLDDELTIYTTIEETKPASLVMKQRICRDGNGPEDELSVIRVKIACVNSAFKPTALPKDLLEKLTKTM